MESGVPSTAFKERLDQVKALIPVHTFAYGLIANVENLLGVSESADLNLPAIANLLDFLEGAARSYANGSSRNGDGDGLGGHHVLLETHAESLAMILAEPVTPVSWLVEGLWTAHSRGFIAGNPGVGKTWLALDLLLSIATGRPAFGRFIVPVPMNVLLVEEESSRESLKRRFAMLVKGRDIPRSELADRFHVLTRQFIKIPKHHAELVAFVKAHSIGVIVFDSFRRIHDAKESSSDEMALIMEGLARLQAETGCSLLLIHHLKKGGSDGKTALWEQLRGSSDLWAWRDCIIGMEETDDPMSAAVSFQFRDAEASAPLLVHRVASEDNTALSLLVEEQTDWDDFKSICDQVLAQLSVSFEPLSATKLRDQLKCRKQEVLAALKHLLSKKSVTQTGHGPKTAWSLAPAIGSGTDGNR